jgi:quinol monooxygenase YgiN
MYGTIAKVKIRPGSLDALKAMSQETAISSRIGQGGHVATYMYQADSDPNELFMVVMFESKAAYHANANSPEQHEQFVQMSQHFAAPPEWHDGQVVWMVDQRLK